MKISGLQNQSLQQTYNKQVERARSAGGGVGRGEATHKSTGDSVELSVNAQLLQKVMQELRTDEGTPAERLNTLRQQVQDDSYEVPMQQLTEQLLFELL
jgi:hypothetical protein